MPGSPDRLYPTGSSPQEARIPVSRTAAYRVRRDLWQAFVRDDGVPRSYDRECDRIVLVRADGKRFIEIRPIPAETQKQWLRQNLTHEPSVDSSSVERLLSSPRWYLEAARPGAIPPGINESWRKERGARIYEEISRWLAENHLSLNLEERSSVTFADVSGRSARETEDRLRQAILNAIHRMPTAELVRLSIPLMYFDRTVLTGGRGLD